VEAELTCYNPDEPRKVACEGDHVKIAQWKEQPQKHKTSTAMEFQGRPKAQTIVSQNYDLLETLKADRKQDLPRLTSVDVGSSVPTPQLGFVKQQNFLKFPSGRQYRVPDDRRLPLAYFASDKMGSDKIT
jgi:hypothetical protein